VTADVVDTATPDDLANLCADDALLDALGGRVIPAAEVLVDDELNGLLWAWRREVDAEPMAVLVDTEQAVALLAQTRPVTRLSLRARAARSVSRLTRRTR
jgi:hypothetical protein